MILTDEAAQPHKYIVPVPSFARPIDGAGGIMFSGCPSVYACVPAGGGILRLARRRLLIFGNFYLHIYRHPACKKTDWRGAGVAICLERGADLHMAQLMPLPLTVSCFIRIQIGFTFLVPAHPGSPGQRPLNGCVCVCFICISSFFPVFLMLCCHYISSHC